MEPHRTRTGPVLRHLAPAVPPVQRRNAARRRVNERCIVTIFNGTEFVRVKGTVQDISTFGLRVKTTLKAARGARIKVLMDRGVVIGDVRESTPNRDGTFDLGVTIDSRFGIARFL